MKKQLILASLLAAIALAPAAFAADVKKQAPQKHAVHIKKETLKTRATRAAEKKTGKTSSKTVSGTRAKEKTDAASTLNK
jgi:hypothetical protein